MVNNVSEVAACLKMSITSSSGEFIDKIWYLITDWLGFVTETSGSIVDHHMLFECLGGFSKNVRLTLNIIWLSCVWVI